MQFNTIQSLGSRCQNADILKHFGYRKFSGFFDFMNTDNINILNHILSDNFNEIMKDENNITLLCNQLTIDPETNEYLPMSYRTGNKFYYRDNIDNAIFPHHDLKNPNNHDKNHFNICIERFKKLKNYNVLFNYTYNTWENDVNIIDAFKIYNTLREKYNFNHKNFFICFIGLKISEDNLDIGYKKIPSFSREFEKFELTIHKGSYTGGIFSNMIDVNNFIKIIEENYDIVDKNKLITKDEIDLP